METVRSIGSEVAVSAKSALMKEISFCSMVISERNILRNVFLMMMGMVKFSFLDSST